MAETEAARAEYPGRHMMVPTASSVDHRAVVAEWCDEPSCPWRRYRHQHDVLAAHAGIYLSIMGSRWAR